MYIEYVVGVMKRSPFRIQVQILHGYISPRTKQTSTTEPKDTATQKVGAPCMSRQNAACGSQPSLRTSPTDQSSFQQENKQSALKCEVSCVLGPDVQFRNQPLVITLLEPQSLSDFTLKTEPGCPVFSFVDFLRFRIYSVYV